MAIKLSMTIDDRDISEFGLKLVEYKTDSFPKKKTPGVDIPGAHGLQVVPSALSSRKLEVTIVCEDTTAEKVNDKIRKFFAFMFSSQNDKSIVFSDDPSIVRYAGLSEPGEYRVIQGVDSAMTQITLTFTMSDPFEYEVESVTISKTLQNGESFILDNDSMECPAVFGIKNNDIEHIHGITDIVLTVNGEEVRILAPVTLPDILVIDTKNYELRLNGIVRLDLWEGEMPQLKNGKNVISISNAEEVPLTVSVRYTKIWI